MTGPGSQPDERATLKIPAKYRKTAFFKAVFHNLKKYPKVPVSRVLYRMEPKPRPVMAIPLG